MSDASPFWAFVEPARHRPALWRLILGIVLVLVVMLAWLALMMGALTLLLGWEGAIDVLLSLQDTSTPLATLVLLGTFVGMLLGPFLAVRLLHGRRAGTLFGPARKTLRHFAVAVGVAAVIYGLTMVMWGVAFEGETNLPPGLWLALLPVSLLGILVQTGAEELLFRGYIMQQLAARFTSALVYMLLPAALFGMLHFDPATMGANVWAVVGSTAFFGLIAADLTRATGSIGAAWGLHFANNVVAILLVATQGTITGLALYVTPYAASEVEITGPLLMADLALVSVVWAVLRWILQR